MKKIYPAKTAILTFALVVLYGFSPLHGADAQRPPIDINLIIDGSQAFADLREEISLWMFDRLDQILMDGDRLTIWNAGASASVIYSATVNSSADRESAKTSIRELSASGSNTDFAGALREAAGRHSPSFSYTLLISASAEALSSVLEGPQANLLRFSRVEEFPAWRALVVGLNIDSRVRRAASAFFGS
jgi:hypothetical protein